MVIIVEGICSSKGYIQLYFFSSSENYVDEKVLYKFCFDKLLMKNGVMVIVVIEVLFGYWGMGVFDDENGNWKMDFGVMFFDEGFGFFNYYYKGMLCLKYDSFDFDFINSGKNIWVKLWYL